MEHLLRRERELQVGREIQRGFLPAELPCPDRWEMTARLRPAQLVAGDFYDGFELANGNRTALLIADVCDKGVGAALFMALIRTLLRHTAQHSGAGTLLPSDLDVIAAVDSGHRGNGQDGGPLLATGAAPLLSAVRGTNDYLTSNHLQQGYFATLFFAVLDPATGVLAYLNCGHNPPVVLRRHGEPVRLGPTGPAVGMAPDSTFELRYVTLAEGETLLAYTDGVTEAKDEHGAFFTERRLLDVLREPVRSATDLLDRIDASVRDFTQAAEQFDDITMLALRRLAPGDPDVPCAPATGRDG
jgi:phosphoserine phosphatase RsbU/P